MHIKYKWQSPPNKVVAYSDSDWAGCTQTRKSTGGGVLMHGSHLVHHWSSTQKVVALISAEAELNAIVKSMTELLCLMNMKKECGRDPKGQILTDSSKVKHLECQQLWVQVLLEKAKWLARRWPD